MGVGIYLKPVTKDGRSLLYLRAKKGNPIFRKSLTFKVKPSDWNARNYQVKVSAIDSIIVNRKLTEITNNMNLAWSQFESGSYTWDEFCTKLGGGNATSNENIYEVILSIKVSATHQDNDVFLIDLIYQGVFEIENLTDDIKEAYLLVECPRILFPFARRIIYDLHADGGLPPLLLDTVNFAELYKNRKAQNEIN